MFSSIESAWSIKKVSSDFIWLSSKSIPHCGPTDTWAFFAASRSFDLITFPDPFVGSSSAISRVVGTLYAESSLRACSIRSLGLVFPGGILHVRSLVLPSVVISVTTACTVCPSTEFSTPKAAACFTAGCECSAASTSAVYTFSPPTNIISVLRSTTAMYPFTSMVAKSPVANQPSSLKQSVCISVLSMYE